MKRRLAVTASQRSLCDAHRSMVIAVAGVRVMQMAAHNIIYMIPVRDRFVSTGGAMAMRLFMSTAGMRGIASGSISSPDCQTILINVINMDEMNVSVVQIISIIYNLYHHYTSYSTSLHG